MSLSQGPSPIQTAQGPCHTELLEQGTEAGDVISSHTVQLCLYQGCKAVKATFIHLQHFYSEHLVKITTEEWFCLDITGNSKIEKGLLFFSYLREFFPIFLSNCHFLLNNVYDGRLSIFLVSLSIFFHRVIIYCCYSLLSFFFFLTLSSTALRLSKLHRFYS